ncbi:MAG: M20 family metallopeptidase [Veillonellales bacterium]
MVRSAEKTVEAYLDELNTLVNIDSGSKDLEGIAKIGLYFEKKFSELGWITHQVNIGEECGLCWEMGNSRSEDIDVLLLGHLDTVFPHGTARERAFKVEGSKAYGPGVADMKGGLLLGYYALKTLQENNRLTGTNVCFAFNSEEELSSTHTRSWLEKLARRSKLVLVLEPGRPNGTLVNTRKGVARYQLEFRGISAHSGANPEKGASAIGELGRWIVELHNLTDFAKGTTVNVGVVAGGTAVNVVAERASAMVDLRFSELSEFSKVDGTIHQLMAAPSVPGVKVDVTGGLTRPPMVPNEKTKALCREIEKMGQENGMDIKWTATGGGSDGNFSAALGIPTIDALGPVGIGAHSPNEYIDISSIPLRLQLLQEIIARGTRGENVC